MQFFKIATYVQTAQLYGLVHYAACVFYPYINGSRFALVSIAGQAVLCGLGLLWHLGREGVRA